MRFQQHAKTRRLLALLGLAMLTSLPLPPTVIAQTASPLSISAPAGGITVTSGQALTVTVAVAPGSYPMGVAVLAQYPLGSAPLQPVSGPTLTFTLAIPANATPGAYNITAVSADANGNELASAPVSVLVERADLPTALNVSPPGVVVSYVGATMPLVVFGTFPGGVQLNVTHSSHLTAVSANPGIAYFQNGTITTAGSGQTTVALTYGQVTSTIAVTVNAGKRGDLNADGKVDQADLNIILAALNTPASGPNDARDLNHDGVINALDARILVTLCTHPGCTQ
jgi:hypothetical protein